MRGARPTRAELEARLRSLERAARRREKLLAALRSIEARYQALSREAEERNSALAAALEQQTATAEILKIISGAPTDVQPVFDTIVRNAGRVCDAVDAVLCLREGDELTVRAHWGPIGAPLGTRRPLTRGSVMGRAIVDARPVPVEDLMTASEFPEGREYAIRWEHRTTLGVPLLREGDALGALLIRRTEVRPFSDAQIAMLQTFADQAVIAIENVRLFTELQARNHDLAQALEQQTATGGILRVISSSPTDVQPVFDTIVRSASELCGGEWAIVVRLDGDLLHLAAQHNPRPGLASAAERLFPRRPGRDLTVGRAVLDGAVVHIPDVNEDTGYDARGSQIARAFLAVPMLREGVPIGAIGVSRAAPGPFAPEQIELLKTFADQAVIAVENVWLFTELQASNRELTTALDQQTATSDILRVISQSQTDVQPVFDAIVASAVRLLGGYSGLLTRLAGDQIDVAALTSTDDAGDAAVRALYPRPLRSEGTHALTIRDRVPLNVADAYTDPRLPATGHATARARGYQSLVVVPLLRHGEAVGAISVSRLDPGGFTDDEIALLKTFADQAVIAIENVRLFTELEGRNRDLTATSEILRVISSSPTDVQPVFSAIADSAAHLTGGVLASVYEFDGSLIHLRVLAPADWPHGDELRQNFPRPPAPDFAAGRVILERAVLHGADLWNDADTPELTRAWARRMDLRSVLWVPMFREGEPIGVIGVTRRESGFFSDEQVRLLQTFADQAVIAIENVRLFTELQTSNRELTTALDQQTATSDILRVISRSQTDVQPVFDAIVASAVRLLGGYGGALTRVAGDQIELAALTSTDAAGDATARAAFPQRLDSEGSHAHAIRDRAPLNIADAHTDPRVPEVGRTTARARGYRSQAVVPLLRHDEAVGTIAVSRREPGGFTDDEIAVLKTFADQAVIAIENVRLFTELEGRNRDLTATSEILRVISSSPTDVQPVFDTIVASAIRLLRAYSGALTRIVGDQIELAALTESGDDAADAALRAFFPRSIQSEGTHALAIRDRAPLNIADAYTDPRMPDTVHAYAHALGYQSQVVVPMLRHDEIVGTIAVTRREAGGFTGDEIELLQTFADQAVIAIENVRLFTELQASNRELTTALDQQTATSDILRVISQSQTDVQPVFDAIVDSAVRLLGAYSGVLTQIAGDQIELAALTSTDAAGDASLRALFPQSLHSEALHAQAIRDRAPLNIADAQTEARVPGAGRATARARGYRSFVVVPLLRHDEALGTISLTRREPGGFSDDEIALLKTFADQAVIAIENVRLFTELEGRNRDLTATSEILRVISSSPSDVQPVFDTIVRSAVQLCDGLFSVLHRFDGELIHHVAQHNYTPEALEAANRIFPARPTRALGTGRAILERAVVHIPDVEGDPEYQHQRLARVVGYRSGLWVPMLREGAPIGVITVARAEAGPFSDSEIGLLKTFADQAVIAVENARLFTELQASNRELTTALDQQTATSDILRVISQSQTDVQPVFDAIVESAVRLLGAYSGALTRLAGDQIELAALTSTDAAGDAGARAVYPQSLESEGPTAQAIRDRAPLNIADAQTDPRVGEAQRASARGRGFRSRVVVPLLRHNEAVGTISVSRREPGGFTDDEIALLKTFADQAVIAIENVRLFNELEGRNRDLTATSEILRVISSSPTDVQPVFDTIARSAVRLCGGIFGAVFRYDGELVHLVAHHNFPPGVLDLLGRMYPMRPSREQATGRAILSGAVAHLSDVVADPEYRQEVARQGGWRSMISVPMFREGATVGAIWVARAQAGPFPENQIELLKTFADQAVIAIENVRLFKELQARTTELTRSVEQLTALGEISRAVSSTLDVETVLQTIVSRASQLAGADGCVIYEYDHATEAFHIRATHNLDPVLVETLRASPLRKGEGAIGRAAETREPTQVADIAVPGAYQSHIRETLLGAGYRALLSVPLLREGEVIGSLSLNRRVPGMFPPEAVEVLKTFATQSALAIQNARLFREIADKSAQLEAASRHKSEFLANMSHELRTPLNAIIGFSEVLVDRMFGELNDKQAEYLRDIHASGQHLLSLINDILDLSKIEAGRMELELTHFDLPQAIDNALTLVRERAGRRGIALHQAVDAGLGQVTGDERKIKQVLLNLLSNALKFTPEGGRIDVRGRVADGMAEVSVTDTGVGIAAEHHDAVFEEFRQVGEAEKKAEGTGLGLALCRKFVELHGGRIWVKSQIGAGSTFAFTLPLDSSP